MDLFGFFNKGPAMAYYDYIRLRSNADMINNEYLAQPWTRYQNLADSFNKAYQQQLYSAVPKLEAGLSRFGDIAESFQKGQLPADTVLGLQKDAAFAGLSGRGTARGEMTQFDLLQNLGLERLNLQQQGQNYNAQMLDFARAMSPEGSGSQYRVDFGTLANRIDQEAFYNNNISNQNKQIAFYNSSRKSPFENFVSNAIGSILMAPLTGLTSLVTAPFSAFSSALGGFAGGLGGGLAQQGLNAMGFGGGTGLGFNPYPSQPVMPFTPMNFAPQQMGVPAYQNPVYQSLGAGPNMQAMANPNMVPTSVAAANPTMIAGSQQKFLTTAPTGASTMPIMMGGGGATVDPYSAGYSYGAGIGGQKSFNPFNVFPAYADFLSNDLFNPAQSRSNAGSAFAK